MFEQQSPATSPAGAGEPDRRDAPEGSGAGHVSTHRLQQQIAELASHIYAGTCRWLELVAEFDRRGGWESFGCGSCAEWLAWRCALGSRAAREHVRVARRLTELPRIHRLFARGELSYAKVRALTRVAAPDSEQELLELARYATAAQLERIVRAYRRLTTEEANKAHEDRHLTWFWDEDGSLAIHGRIPGEGAALVLRALEAAHERLREDSRDGDGGSAEPGSPQRGSAEPVPDTRQTNADALVHMAEASLQEDGRSRSGRERTQVVVHVDAHTLAADEREECRGTASHRRCDLDEVAIAPETARRLACDSSLVSILEHGDGSTLSVGRRRRTIPPAVQRALRARDGACRFPGCENRRYVDAHHITHWAHGGETRLDNLMLLCRRHHRLLHEGGFAIERRADGELRFRAPGGWELDPVPPQPRGDPVAVARWNADAGIAIGADTCLNGTGERLDVGLAVEAVAAAAATGPDEGARGRSVG